MRTSKQIAEELLDSFMWCCTSSGHTSPLAKEEVKDIVKKHIELIKPFLQRIDGEFNVTDELQDLYQSVLIEIEKL
jgi:hypothetical protein